MLPIRPLRFVRPRAGPVFAAIAIAACRPGLVAAPVCDGEFTLTTQPTAFDGGNFDQIKLVSPAVTLLAFSFGAWMPVESGGHTGVVLRHRNHPAVFTTICPLTGGQVPASEAALAAYLKLATSDLGTEPAIGELADTAEDATKVRVLGWRTREIWLHSAAGPGLTARAELHVIALQGRVGAAFVLSGPAAEVEATTQDFRFLLSRLTVR